MAEDRLNSLVPLKKAITRGCILKKVFLKISLNSQEITCVTVSCLIKLQVLACNFIKKETLALVLSCEVCEIFKNIYFEEHLRTADPANTILRYSHVNNIAMNK